MGQIIALPLNVNSSILAKDFILKQFSYLLPNLSNLLILTASYNAAEGLKLQFAKEKVILPKIIALAELEKEITFLNPSSLHYNKMKEYEGKIHLYKIVKKYYSGFSAASVFNYIEDFIKLENASFLNQFEILKSLQKLQEIIPNMAKNLQLSLANFFKILIEWQTFKEENKLTSLLESSTQNIEFVTQNLNSLGFEAICTFACNGTSKLQVNLMF